MKARAKQMIADHASGVVGYDAAATAMDTEVAQYWNTGRKLTFYQFLKNHSCVVPLR